MAIRTFAGVAAAWISLSASGCFFGIPPTNACASSADCVIGRVCEGGVCVVATDTPDLDSPRLDTPGLDTPALDGAFDGVVDAFDAGPFDAALDADATADLPIPTDAPTCLVTGPSIAVGRGTACVVDAGVVLCWQSMAGASLARPYEFVSTDLLGRGTVVALDTTRTVPAPVGGGGAPPASGFAAVFMGGRHACALDCDGRAWCWGSSPAVIGRIDGSDDSVPAPLDRVRADGERLGDLRFTTLTLGLGFTCGVTVDAEVECWGDGDPRFLGPDGLGPPTPAFASIRSLASSYGSACVLGDTAGGTAAAWCEGTHSRPTMSTASWRGLPTMRGRSGATWGAIAPGLLEEGPTTEWSHLALAAWASCGVANDEVYCWGNPFRGEGSVSTRDQDGGLLGPGTHTTNVASTLLDELVGPGETVLALANGGALACVLVDTGPPTLRREVRCWGTPAPFGTSAPPMTFDAMSDLAGDDWVELAGYPGELDSETDMLSSPLWTGRGTICARSERGTVACIGEDLQSTATGRGDFSASFRNVTIP